MSAKPASLLFREGYLAGAALIAAALGDPLVENVSNTGIFGTHYSDTNHISIVPALVAGVLLVLVIIGLRCVEMCMVSAGGRRDWLVDVATAISTRSPARDFPCVFGMQLAALFAMESTEQVLLGGKLLGGTVWLGGPIAFSLLTHAVIGAGCILLLKWFVRSMLATFASLVCIALEFILITRTYGVLGALLRRSEEPECHRAQAPHVRQIGERAPPLHLTLA
jgi:hypothetical protein